MGVTVQENVSVKTGGGKPSVYDSPSITENIKTVLVAGMLLFETVGVAEAVTVKISSPTVSVNDTVTVAEDITVNPLSLVDISVEDSASVAEDIVVDLTLRVSVYDSTSVAEDVVSRSKFFVSVYDSPSLTEDVTVGGLAPTTLSIDVYDATSLTEDISVDPLGLGSVSVDDSISVAEDINNSLSNLTISVVDNASLSEDVNVLVKRLVSVYDSVSLSEDISSTISDLVISLYDTVSLAEDIEVLLKSIISVVDNISVAEDIALTISNSKISVYDSVSLSEDITVTISNSKISVQDTVSLTEDIATNISNPQISVYDNVTISEDITTFTDKYYLSVQDNVSLTENISVVISNLKPNVFDSPSITEDISVYTVIPPFTIDVFDNISVVDSVIDVLVDYTRHISLYDSVTVTEDISGVASLRLSIFDSSSLTEDISATHVLNVYPVVGGTFGKTTKGGTEHGGAKNNQRICKFTSGSAGTLASISVYLKYSTANSKVKCAIYDSSFNLLTNGTTEEKTVTSNQDGFLSFNFATPPNITATTVYYLGWWTDEDVKWYYGSGSANQYAYGGEVYDSWDDPLDLDGYAAREVSIYANYPTEGPVESVSVIESITANPLILPGIDVYDVASITESIISNLLSLINVNDAVTINEYIKHLLVCTISKSETISVVESITNALSIPGISVSDVISLFEGIYLDLWIQRIQETDTWTERTKETDTWTQRTKPTDTWTQRTKEDDGWLELNGNGYASISDASQTGLDMGLSDFMLEARIKTSTTGEWQILIDKYLALPSWSWFIRNTDGVQRFNIVDVGETIVHSNTAVNDGEWNYIVLVVDRSGNVYFYLNGSSDGSGDISTRSGTLDNADRVTVGADIFDGAKLTGLIDEIRIWNFGVDGLPTDYADYITWRNANPLAPTSHYNGGSWNTYVTNNLSAYYKFNGDYTDETSNSNDLTAGGSGNNFRYWTERTKEIDTWTKVANKET